MKTVGGKIFMRNNIIIELFDTSFECIISYYNNPNYKIYKVVYYWEEIEKEGCYDTVIFLDNRKVDYIYAYQKIVKYIDVGKNIILYYKISDNDFLVLKEYARQRGIHIERKYFAEFNNGIVNIDVPVVFISGAGRNCDQLNTHLILKDIFEKKKIKTLNYSNTIYSDMFNFTNLNSLFDISNLNFYNLYRDTNKKINDDIVCSGADVLIISDMNGIIPYNAVEHNYFGLYNNIIKYACPYDYLIYNLYATEYDKKSINNMISKVVNYTNINTICLGVAHASTTMHLGGLANSDEYVELMTSEYDYFYNNMQKITNYDLIDPRSYEAIDNYISKFVV